MSESRDLLVAMTERLFAENCDKALLDRCQSGEWPAAFWQMLVAAGLVAAATPEALGGAGADLGDAMALFRLCGQAALPVPLVETVLANWLLGEAGLTASKTPLALAPTMPADRASLAMTSSGMRLSLRLAAVVVTGSPEHMAVVAESAAGPHLCLVELAQVAASATTRSIAGDALLRLEVEGVQPKLVQKLPPSCNGHAVLRLGAVARAMQIAGALERILMLSVQYAGERVQFGRPIAKFQAIQHALAALAGEAAAAAASAQAAAETAPSASGALMAATAKLRGGEAATAGTALAHQIHGAMGFTAEHQLHHLTRRLWSWRDEFGAEAYWAREIGRDLLRPDAGPLWPMIAV